MDRGLVEVQLFQLILAGQVPVVVGAVGVGARQTCRVGAARAVLEDDPGGVRRPGPDVGACPSRYGRGLVGGADGPLDPGAAVLVAGGGDEAARYPVCAVGVAEVSRLKDVGHDAALVGVADIEVDHEDLRVVARQPAIGGGQPVGGGGTDEVD